MDLRQIRYFLAIADHGGFTSAAAALHVAQPSLSHTIRTLEREVGSSLFVRHAKGTTLTAAGEALVAPARQILRDFDTAKAAISDVLGLNGGHLSIASIPWLAVFVLPEPVGALRQQHPAVTCTIRELDSDRDLIELVADGTCELGFVFVPPSGVAIFEGYGVEYEPLGVEEYFLAAPPGTDLPDGPVELGTLTDVPWVAPAPGVAARDAIETMLRSAGVSVRAAVQLDAREALMRFVLAGAGYTVLSSVEATIAAERGATVRSLSPTLHREYGMVYRRRPALSPAATLLKSILKPGTTTAPRQ